MAGRGSLFAVGPADRDELLARLKAQPSTEATLLLNDEKFKEYEEAGWRLELDKAWDGIHRCLAKTAPDEDWLVAAPDASPAAHAIGGGSRLTPQDDEWVVHLMPARLTKKIAKAIAKIDDKEMARRYDVYCKTAWGGGYDTPEDVAYTVSYFSEAQAFYQRAAKAGRDVVFMVDL